MGRGTNTGATADDDVQVDAVGRPAGDQVVRLRGRLGGVYHFHFSTARGRRLAAEIVALCDQIEGASHG